MTNAQYRNSRNNMNVHGGAIRKTNVDSAVLGSNTNVSVASTTVSTTATNDRDQARNVVADRIARRNDRIPTTLKVGKSENEMLREQLNKMKIEMSRMQPKIITKQKPNENSTTRSNVAYPQFHGNSLPERTSVAMGHMSGLGVPLAAASTPKGKKATSVLSAKESNELFDATASIDD